MWMPASQKTRTGVHGGLFCMITKAILLSAWGVVPHCQCAKAGEDLASLEVLNVIVHLAANPVILECDNAAVVHEL
jgi:hypothetical protein